MRVFAAVTMQPMVVDKKTARMGFAARLGGALTAAGVPDNQKRRSWVAETFGVSVESARKWLMGESMPDTARIEGLARRLGVGANWLLTGQQDAQTPTSVSEQAGAYAVPTHALGIHPDLYRALEDAHSSGALTPPVVAAMTAIVRALTIPRGNPTR